MSASQYHLSQSSICVHTIFCQSNFVFTITTTCGTWKAGSSVNIGERSVDYVASLDAEAGFLENKLFAITLLWINISQSLKTHVKSLDNVPYTKSMVYNLLRYFQAQY